MNNVLLLFFLFLIQFFIVQSSASPSQGNSFPTSEEFVQNVLSGEIFSQAEIVEIEIRISKIDESKEDDIQHK